MVSHLWKKAIPLIRKEGRRMRVLRVAMKWCLQQRDNKQFKRHMGPRGEDGLRECLTCHKRSLRTCSGCRKQRQKTASQQCLRYFLRRLRFSKANREQLDAEWVAQQILKQHGRCAISGRVLALRTFSDWKASVTRIDNAKSWTKENTHVVCNEFASSDWSVCVRQGRKRATDSARWTKEKFDDVNMARRVYPKIDVEWVGIQSKQRRLVDMSSNTMQCTWCNKMQPSTLFTKMKNSGDGFAYRCAQCNDVKSSTLCENARSIFHRVKRRVDKYDGLTMNDVIKLYQEQGGRCAYTGIPMSLKPHTRWRMSIERIDNALGYGKDNCCLIVAECNTSDHSLGKSDVGSAQWSKEKADACWGSYNDQPCGAEEPLEIWMV